MSRSASSYQLSRRFPLQFSSVASVSSTDTTVLQSEFIVISGAGDHHRDESR